MRHGESPTRKVKYPLYSKIAHVMYKYNLRFSGENSHGTKIFSLFIVIPTTYMYLVGIAFTMAQEFSWLT